MRHKFEDSDVVGVQEFVDGHVALILNAEKMGGEREVPIVLSKSDIAMIAMYADLVVYPKDSKVKCGGEK